MQLVYLTIMFKYLILTIEGEMLFIFVGGVFIYVSLLSKPYHERIITIMFINLLDSRGEVSTPFEFVFSVEIGLFKLHTK